MSLIPFHRLLIASAIVFCLGFSVWELVAYSRDGRIGALVIGAVFGVAGISLAVYLRHLRRVLGLPAMTEAGRQR